MELFVLRHGHAETEAPKDSLRELSARGKVEVREAIRADKESFSKLERIIVSPFLRAQQTSEIVLDELGEIPKYDSDWLVPATAPDALITYLYTVFHEENISSLMLVSHQPLMGVLVDELCGLEPGKYRLSTASIAAIDVKVLAQDCCKLRWLHHVS